MALLDRIRGLAKSRSEHEADDIRADLEHRGVAPVAEIRDRHHATVCGTIRSVTLPPKKSVPVLVAEVFDGERAVDLIWIGRRAIGGVEPGVFLRARGRVSVRRGVPTIFNPAYEIVPAR